MQILLGLPYVFTSFCESSEDKTLRHTKEISLLLTSKSHSDLAEHSPPPSPLPSLSPTGPHNDVGYLAYGPVIICVNTISVFTHYSHALVASVLKRQYKMCEITHNRMLSHHALTHLTYGKISTCVGHT